jgi:hypothetical protein
MVDGILVYFNSFLPRSSQLITDSHRFIRRYETYADEKESSNKRRTNNEICSIVIEK